MDNRPIVANLDFDSIKADIINYYKSKPEFKDYDFTGSGLNLLIDMLAYNTHYMALTANMALNESFLDTALVRSSVVSHAKLLNYTPRSARSAKAVLRLSVPKLSTDSTTAAIPAGSVFRTTGALNFVTIEPYIVKFPDGATTGTIDVSVYEGKINTNKFIHQAYKEDEPNYELKNRSFQLQNKNADMSTLTVSVNGVKWSKVTPENEGTTALNGDSTVYFIEESRSGFFRLVFGDGVIGKKLSVGDSVVCTYVVGGGTAGNGVSFFVPVISGRPGVKVTELVQKAQGGDFKESIKEIRDNAPKWYASQYRAVTTDDYEVAIRKKYTDIQDVNVFGGEQIGRPGFVFICAKPKTSDKLPDSAKNSIKHDILDSMNVVTVRPLFIDPVVLKLVLRTVVTYDPTKLGSTEETIAAKVTALFNVFNNSYIGKFRKNFKESNLSYEIKKLDAAITGSNTRIDIRYENIVTSTQQLTLESWSYNNKLYHPYDGFNADNGGVFRSSFFKIEGSDSIWGFDDDGYGNIRFFEYKDKKKIYSVEKAGIINYNTGDVSIDYRPRYSAQQTINFTAALESFDVIGDKQSILLISTDGSDVKVIDETNEELFRSITSTRSI